MNLRATPRPRSRTALPPLSPVDPLTGIVTFVMEGERHRSDPEVFAAVAQTGNLERLRGVTEPPHITGSGTGLRRQDAYWSAVGEALERYCFGEIPVEQVRVGTYAELRAEGREAFLPSSWTLFRPAQHAAADVPFAPFDDATPIGWVEGWDLHRRRPVSVPACLVYMPYAPRSPGGELPVEQVIGPAISTGSACATTAEEAVFKGVCEVVERDALMVVWRSRVRCPRLCVDAGSSLHDLVRRVFERPGLEFELYLTTLDLGVPSVFGILRNRRPGAPPGVVVAGACHPDPRRAVLKTYLEMSQALLWMHHVGNPGFDPGPEFANLRSFDDRMRAYAFNDLGAAFEFLRSTPDSVNLSDLEAAAPAPGQVGLDWMLERLSAAGLEAAAVDLTTADVAQCGLHVYKTLIPGCVPMEGDARLPALGGRRWQEVPQRLGRVRDPGLNPYPHPYP